MLKHHITFYKTNMLGKYSTFVIAVKTFSRIALGWAFCGPLAWTLRPKAQGLAINLQQNKEERKSNEIIYCWICYQ